MPINVKQIIRALLDEHDEVRPAQIVAAAGVSRQGAHYHLKAMVAAGELERLGAGRGTRYRRASSARGQPSASVTISRPLAGLQEDRLWQQLRGSAGWPRELSRQALDVLQYALTELANNAIEHSGGDWFSVELEIHGPRLTMVVADDGVGAFAHVRERLGLASELEALQVLSKGKTTTAPDRHTGEGLFFTSKAVDLFELEAGVLRWLVDNERDEHAVGGAERKPGTLVRIEMRPEMPRDLHALFAEYTEDFEFSRTRIVVKLFEIGVRFVSRSEAKRLLGGLEKFRVIVLDFKGVELAGQGFADEVFRVWPRAHAGVRLEPVNMIEPVAFMVERARRRAARDS